MLSGMKAIGIRAAESIIRSTQAGKNIGIFKTILDSAVSKTAFLAHFLDL